LTDQSHKGQIKELTSLRGIAAWWVVFYHFGAYWSDHTIPLINAFVGNGFLAVDLFFVLSGFVIYLVHGNEFEKPTRALTMMFLLKRLARIYPLHIVILFLYLSVPAALILFSSSGTVPSSYNSISFIYKILLIDSWGLDEGLTWNVPSWSISAEWAVYLSFPILAPFIGKMERSMLALSAGLVGLFVLMTTFVFAVGFESLGEMIIGFGVIRCLFQFTIGCILSALYKKWGSRLDTCSSWLFCFGSFIFILLAFDIIGDVLFAPLAFSMLILALTRERSWLTSGFRFQPIVYLGEISYSTYMIHYLVYDWFKLLFVEVEGNAPLFVLVATFGCIFVLSAGFHTFLERPAQKLFRTKIKGFMATSLHSSS
jgi:peptidoglycan/LPS O-acetylase OafA/YrhL